jgi:FAD/FMN-containing dehydrogenase
MTTVETRRALDDDTVGALAAALRGRLIRPAEPEFDAARAVWNGMIDRRPALIAQCTGVADVRTAVGFARDNRIPATVRGGGHSVAGRSVADDTLLIDLGSMRWARVDQAARIVRVGPGTVGGEMDHETQAFGLATPGGTDSTTGVVGLTLGGGMGFLGRRYGLAIDNLLSAEVVLADGRVVHASATEHPDLFWAIRGGGGGFGVVTDVELQLHVVGPQLAVAQTFLPWEDAPAVLRFYRDYTADMVPEMACYLLAARVPPIDPFPAAYQGRTAILLVASHAGDVDAGLAALRPITDLGEPIFSFRAPMAYTALQQTFDPANPAGRRYFWKAEYMSALTDEAIDAFVEQADPLVGPFSAAFFEALGGAVADHDPADTAFPHRHAAYNFAVCAGWDDPAADADSVTWARRFHATMAPFGTGGVYANYVGLDDVAHPQAVFGENNARLASVRAEYDPDGVFSEGATTHG